MNQRRAAAIAFGLLAIVLIAAIVLTTPWKTLSIPDSESTPVDLDRDFTAGQQQREDAFHSARQPWSYAQLLLNFGVAAVLGLTPWGARIVAAVAKPLGGGWIWRVLLGSLAILALSQLLTLPLAAHKEQVLRDYGLSTQDWPSWLSDVAKSFGIGYLAAAIILLGFFGLVKRAPRTWWIWAATGGAALTIGLSFIYPLVIEPVFLQFHSMPEGELRTSLIDLAERDEVHVSDVLVADASRRSTSLNAYVSGFGSTRRIVVYDNLLNNAPPSEVRMVVAHELGHVKNNDVLHGTLIGALGVAICMCAAYLVLTWPPLLSRAGVSAISDSRSLALLVFFVFACQLVTLPVTSLVTRRIEERADVHALDLTEDPSTFRDMQIRLSAANLSDLDPTPVTYALFFNHPTSAERIALARDWANQHHVRVP